jgi:hypothetical protein
MDCLDEKFSVEYFDKEENNVRKLESANYQKLIVYVDWCYRCQLERAPAENQWLGWRHPRSVRLHYISSLLRSMFLILVQYCSSLGNSCSGSHRWTYFYLETWTCRTWYIPSLFCFFFCFIASLTLTIWHSMYPFSHVNRLHSFGRVLIQFP